MSEHITEWQAPDTINESVVALAEQFPHQELYIFYNNGTRASYTALDLYTLAGRFASRLHRFGFKSEDCIANTLSNSPERVVSDLGIILAGCIPVNAQHLLSDGSDLYRTAQKSKCKCIILSNNKVCPTWNLLNSYISGNSSDFVSDLSIDQTPEMTSAIVVSRQTCGTKKPLLEDLSSSDEEIFVHTAKPTDIAVVFCTSGSTGYSKLVPRTQREIVRSSLQEHSAWFRKTFGSDGKFLMYNDRLLGWGGGFSVYSIVAAVPKVLRDNYDMDESTANQDFWEAVSKEGCTFSIMVPLEVEKRVDYIKRVGGDIPRKFNYIIAIGQPMTKMQVKTMCQISETVVIMYGSTECTSVSGITAKNNKYESYNCGKPSKGVAIRVVNETNELCPTNEIGTIQVKSDKVLQGYFNKSEEPDHDTVAAFTSDGWLKMEDYGFLDEEGNLFVLGRNKDVINYGASVIYPGWLEAKIAEHPDVLQASIVPVSDPSLYQNICACVKVSTNSTASPEEIQTFCENIFLPNSLASLTPKPAFVLVFKEDFPELSTGKPDKQTLKRIAEHKFGYKEND